MKTIKTILVLIIFVTILGYYPSPALATVPTMHGQLFAWANNPRRELNEEEAQFLAHNYDLVVIGFQGDPQATSARRIKEINPNIKLLVYFPTSIRQIGAHYGQAEFKEEWYLHDFSGNRINKTSTIQLIDLTNPDYREWARTTVIGFLNLAPYDGVVFDNANPISAEMGNLRNLITEEKLNAWNEARTQYLTSMTNILNNRNKLLIYNGIHRARSKTNRTLSTLDFTNGALNENFCYGQNNAGNLEFVSKELQLEDVNLQKNIGQSGKVVLQKVNWGGFDQASEEERRKVGRYCYGIFLMGHVPDYTFFKFGQGYNLFANPEEYKTRPLEADLLFTQPIGTYQRQNWLLSRKFSNGYVVLNLDSVPNTWVAPEKLELWNNNAYQKTVAQGESHAVNPETADYFLKPTAKKAGDLNGDGKVDIFDYNILVSDFGKTGSPGWIPADIDKNGKVDIFDYNLLIGNFGK